MSTYFSLFPKVSYNKIPVIDITRRNIFLSYLNSNPFVFLPYTIKEKEKPEDISLYYYGSVKYTWLVLLANNILDPYYDWPLDEEQFNLYLMSKYKDIINLKGVELIDWLKNNQIYDNVVYYYKENNNDVISLNPESFETEYELDEAGNIIRDEYGRKIIISRTIPIEWTPMRIYDYEYQLNENKREIKLVDRNNLSQIEKEFKKLMSNK